MNPFILLLFQHLLLLLLHIILLFQDIGVNWSSQLKVIDVYGIFQDVNLDLLSPWNILWPRYSLLNLIPLGICRNRFLWLRFIILLNLSIYYLYRFINLLMLIIDCLCEIYIVICISLQFLNWITLYVLICG